MLCPVNLSDSLFCVSDTGILQITILITVTMFNVKNGFVIMFVLLVNVYILD